MNTGERLVKIRIPTAEILGRFTLSQAGAASARSELAPAVVLDALMAADCWADCVRLLAFGLPKREAVWWACLCARHTMPDVLPELESVALAAAEGWVLQPGEASRRASWAAVEALGFEAPVSWCAVAAFWSGGSMAPPDTPRVPPGELLTAKAVSAAVLLAAARHDSVAMPQRFRNFIAWGIDIANGGRGQQT